MRKSWKLRLGLSVCAAAAACAGALYLYFMGPQNIPLPCVFYSVTGLYCPGCGGTRAILSLLDGEFVQSFLYHPFVPYAAAICILFLFSNILYRLRIAKKRFLLRPVYLLSAVAIIIGQCAVKNLLILL